MCQRIHILSYLNSYFVVGLVRPNNPMLNITNREEHVTSIEKRTITCTTPPPVATKRGHHWFSLTTRFPLPKPKAELMHQNVTLTPPPMPTKGTPRRLVPTPPSSIPVSLAHFWCLPSSSHFHTLTHYFNDLFLGFVCVWFK